MLRSAAGGITSGSEPTGTGWVLSTTKQTDGQVFLSLSFPATYRFDSELSQAQEEAQREKLQREKLGREKDMLIAEVFSLKQQLEVGGPAASGADFTMCPTCSLSLAVWRLVSSAQRNLLPSRCALRDSSRSQAFSLLPPSLIRRKTPTLQTSVRRSSAWRQSCRTSHRRSPKMRHPWLKSRSSSGTWKPR